MPKVSVIIPVYNAEKHVERALNSLIEQTLEDVQYIIIDDGSIDNSLTVVKKVLDSAYKEIKDITLITRENRGVSATRSQGIHLAKGDYVIHLDSDDWLEPNALELMYNNAIMNQSDVVISNYFVEYLDRCVQVQQPHGYSNIDCLKMMLIGDIPGFTWNKLIKRELLLVNAIDFNEELSFLEDFLFIFKVLYKSKKTTFIDECLIHYSQENEFSITRKMTNKHISDVIKVIDDIESFLNRNKLESIVNEELNIFKIYNKYTFLNATYRCKSNKYLAIYPESYKKISKVKLGIHAKFVLQLSSYNMQFMTIFLLYLIDLYKGSCK